ncbi:MAG: helix-turn-helix domain-containing protein [Bacteroidota bacterium]|nr:helix-turn-helix domain-containing protein [Bacteroidota bacterium]
MHNPELELAEKFVQLTNKNIFLTGKAGTGKTTFLRSLKHKVNKRLVVVAPTGVAAINAGGVTMHSFFQLPFGPVLTERVAGHKVHNPSFRQKFNKQKINIIKTLDLLVIDEISMVRADILDAIDDILRRYKNRHLPFGGVQLLMIGDLQQLAPVVKPNEMQMLSPYYNSMYFFNSKALQKSDMTTVELKHIYRQRDNTFVQILNEIRDDKLTEASYNLLHKRYIPDFKPENSEGYITLTTHNKSADTINAKRLKAVEGRSHAFEAKVAGRFSEYAYPTDYKLELKAGAQVMFVKNDSAAEKRYFNGKIGTVVDFDEDNILVKCKGDKEIIKTGKETWENVRYKINQNTKEISEDFIGSFTQYPLRAAWAVTIHKSQGLTFEKAVIDANAAFAHGQTYVALSRCTTLEGLVLSSKIEKSAIICDREVRDFNKEAEKNQPDENELHSAIHTYQKELIEDLFSYNQLQFRFRTLEKHLRENEDSFSGTISDTVKEINTTPLPKINGIARAFIKEVRLILNDNPDAENNQKLTKRLTKAVEYFTDFHQSEIIDKIEDSSFETDNASVNKVIEESLQYCFSVLNIKQKSLNSCSQGFSVEKFLNIRAKAALDKQKKSKAKVKVKAVETKYPELYQELKEWRQVAAESDDKKAFMVAHNSTLQEIANSLPVSTQQLKSINGIGKAKLEEYGEMIISIVSEFAENHDIEPNQETPILIEPVKKKNWQISFEMYKEGKSIKEIADAQGFVISTIENHLGRYIESGDIKIDELVEPEISKQISDYFQNKPEALLSDAKSALPDKISYSEIKCVQQHINYLNKTVDNKS